MQQRRRHSRLQGPPPSSRDGWPTRPPDRARADQRPTSGVTPPWQDDDLRLPVPPETPGLPEPPPLRPAEPPEDFSGNSYDPLAGNGYDLTGNSYDPLTGNSYDPLAGNGYDLTGNGYDPLAGNGYDPLAGNGHHPERLPMAGNGIPRNGIPRSAPPVSADDDDTLLIFAQTRSAWFSDEDDDATWGSALDMGWRAAERAAEQPTVGERTDAGLPRRVPRANLLPGSPDQDRPLRVVRDPASIAAHTSGYFNGWRRGQESGGYALGGRQHAAGAWEFSREDEHLTG